VQPQASPHGSLFLRQAQRLFPQPVLQLQLTSFFVSFSFSLSIGLSPSFSF
jgi:hypothetical protein